MKLPTFSNARQEAEAAKPVDEVKKESAFTRFSHGLLRRSRGEPRERLKKTTSEVRLRKEEHSSSVGCFPQRRSKSASCPVRKMLAIELKQLEVDRENELKNQLNSPKALKLLTGLKTTVF
uniref:Uncharacterized protein n=1 Tax=Steinernema glaseri TaxID=37863 RepID=A0A1I8AHR8_9BILA